MTSSRIGGEMDLIHLSRTVEDELLVRDNPIENNKIFDIIATILGDALEFSLEPLLFLARNNANALTFAHWLLRADHESLVIDTGQYRFHLRKLLYPFGIIVEKIDYPILH